MIKYSDFYPFDKPSVRLQLYLRGKRKYKLDALLDSGADITSLPVSLSESILGIPLEDMTEQSIERMGGILSNSHCFCGKDIKSIMLPIEIDMDGHSSL